MVHRNCIWAFSRTDLIVVVAVSIVLAGLAMLFASRSHHSSNVTLCAANLKELGLATAMYEKDHQDELPYAYIMSGKGDCKVWDGLIFPYTHQDTNSLAAKQLLLCPSDTIGVSGRGNHRRTYSMSADNMKDENWPLGPNIRTGVGVWWAKSTRRGTATLSNLTNTTDPMAFRLDMIQAPDQTLLLTEKAQSNNVAFYFSGAVIYGPSEHVDKRIISPNDYHGGKFNYLMVDGHVELLTPEQTLGESAGGGSGSHNIWTVRPDD